MHLRPRVRDRNSRPRTSHATVGALQNEQRACPARELFNLHLGRQHFLWRRLRELRRSRTTDPELRGIVRVNARRLRAQRARHFSGGPRRFLIQPLATERVGMTCHTAHTANSSPYWRLPILSSPHRAILFSRRCQRAVFFFLITAAATTNIHVILKGFPKCTNCLFGGP